MLQLKTVPAVVKHYVEREHMHLIRTVNSKIVKSAVVAKIGIYGEGARIQCKQYHLSELPGLELKTLLE